MAACLAAEWTCRFSQSTIHSVSAASTEEAMSWVDSMIERPLSANCLRRRFISSRPATSRNAVGSSSIISGVFWASARASITFWRSPSLSVPNSLSAYVSSLFVLGAEAAERPGIWMAPYFDGFAHSQGSGAGAVGEYHGESFGKFLFPEAAQSRAPYAHCAGSWRLCSRESAQQCGFSASVGAYQCR